MKPSRRLKIGDTVPEFWTRDIAGSEVDSRKLKRNTLIVFLRFAGCPFCNLAIYRLTLEHRLLKKQGCDVFVYFDNDQKSAAPADARRLVELMRPS